MIIKKLLAGLILGFASSLAVAAGGGGCGGLAECQKANIDPNNQASLQRGMKLFVNYCLGCHSAKYQRYNRAAADLGMSDDLVRDNLMFTGHKIGDTMDNAMPPRQASKWFGQVPPDLTLKSREKGVDYVYTFLKTFYVDPKAPTGTNNAVLKNASMPWPMWELQGYQKAVKDSEGHITGFEAVSEGSMTADEFDGAVRDLVNFMNYMGEPIKGYRQALGLRVMFFLLLLLVLSYFLKREYWKEVN